MPQRCPTASLRLPAVVVALLLQIGIRDVLSQTKSQTQVFITHIPKTGGASLELDLARYRDRNCPRAIRRSKPKWMHRPSPIPEKCHAGFEFLSFEAYVVYNPLKFNPFLPESYIYPVLRIKSSYKVTLLDIWSMFARNQCTKRAPFNVLIRTSSSIKYTVWLCWRTAGHECVDLSVLSPPPCFPIFPVTFFANGLRNSKTTPPCARGCEEGLLFLFQGVSLLRHAVSCCHTCD